MAHSASLVKPPQIFNFGVSSTNELPPASSHLTRTLAFASASCLVIASAGMGAIWAWSTGSQHGLALGALSVLMAVALECCKPLALSHALSAFGSFKLVRGLALTLLAGVAIAYSLTAELGLMAGARGDVVAERSAALRASSDAQGDAQRARERYDAAKTELANLPASRPAAEVQAEVDALLLTPGADGCTTINGRVTKTVCPQVAALRIELGRAQRRSALEALMAQPMPAAPHAAHDVGQADPAAAALVVYLTALGVAVAPERLTEWLALIPVLALEVGSALAGVLVQAVSPPAARRTPERRSEAVTGEEVGHGVDHPEPPLITDDAAAREKVKIAILDQLEKRGGSVASSERGLAALIGTSRPTVRRAIHGLMLAGVIAAEAGRNGTLLRLVA